MWEKKRKLMNRYNSSADSYDRRYEDIQKQKFQSVWEEIEGSESILDVGCGTGLFLEEISDEEMFSVGVDFSFDMLQKAMSKSQDMILVIADADNLPFSDEVFEIVISFTLLQNMPDPEQTLLEMVRVVQEKGKVIVSTLRKKHSPDELTRWMSEVGLKSVRVEKISDSEDFLCVGRKGG